MRSLSNADLAHLLGQPIFHHLSTAADDLQLECYIVGDYVRDLLLEQPPNDTDVMVMGSSIRAAEALGQRPDKQAHLPVFRNSGTVRVKYQGQEVKFVGIRKESYNHDLRKPVVEDGTSEDDQNRRDFTINAMVVCLNEAKSGELVDPFGGLLDLEDGIIRTPLDPNITFFDDPLCMVRCVRFATQSKFFIEDEIFETLQHNRERIETVGGECIIDGLNKIMMTDHPSRGFVELYRCGLLEFILPEFTLMDIVETRNGWAHKNNFYYALGVVDNICQHTGNLRLRWAASLHDIGKPRSKRWGAQAGWTFHNYNHIGSKMIPDIFRRPKFPTGSKMKYVQEMADMYMRPIVIADEEVTDSAVCRLISDAGSDVDGFMMLCKTDIISRNTQRGQRLLDNLRMVYEKSDGLKERDYEQLLQPCVDRNGIIEMLHLQPSCEVRTLKQVPKDAVLDNKVPNKRESLMVLLIEKTKRMGLDVLQEQE